MIIKVEVINYLNLNEVLQVEHYIVLIQNFPKALKAFKKCVLILFMLIT